MANGLSKLNKKPEKTIPQVDIMREISGVVVEKLNSIGITQATVANVTGKDKGTVSKIFNGLRVFSLDDLNVIGQNTPLPIAAIIFSYFYNTNDINPEFKKAYGAMADAAKYLEENF